MKVELVPMYIDKNVKTSEPSIRALEPEFFTLDISGSLDRNNETLKKARELVLKSRNPEMVKAFDRSVEEGLLFAFS